MSTSNNLIFGASPERRRLVHLVSGMMLFPGVLMVVLGAVFAGSEADVSLVMGVILLIIVAPFVLYIQRWLARLQLRVDATGIQVFNRRALPLITWNEVAFMNLTPASEGLILTHTPDGLSTPMERETAAMRVGYAPLTPDDIRVYVGRGQFLDLRPFAGHFSSSDLLERIYAFAPHLVSKPKHPELAMSDKEKVELRKRQWAVFGGIAVVILGSFLAGLLLDGEGWTAETQATIDSVLYFVLGLAVGVTGLANVSAFTSRLKAKFYQSALLWLSLGAVQVLLGFVLLISAFE